MQLELISIRPYKRVVRIKKNNRLYDCFIRNKTEIIIRNEFNVEINFLISDTVTTVTNKKDNPYINSLKVEAMTALGLLP